MFRRRKRKRGRLVGISVELRDMQAMRNYKDQTVWIEIGEDQGWVADYRGIQVIDKHTRQILAKYHWPAGMEWKMHYVYENDLEAPCS